MTVHGKIQMMSIDDMAERIANETGLCPPGSSSSTSGCFCDRCKSCWKKYLESENGEENDELRTNQGYEQLDQRQGEDSRAG